MAELIEPSGADKIGELAYRASKAVGTTAGYVQSRDLQEMLSDAEYTARNNPVPALIAAASVGFLFGVLLRRS